MCRRVYYQLRNASSGFERCGHPGKPPCGNTAPQPNYDKGPILTAVAESRDGRTFTKPLLHRYRLRGSTANNILGRVCPAVQHSDWGGEPENSTDIDSIFIDPTAEIGSPRRYRGLSGNLAFYSADGLNWTAEQYRWDGSAAPLFDGDWVRADPPLIFYFACACAQSQSLTPLPPDQGTTGYDTQPVVFYDPPCKCYSWYTRFKNEPPRPAPWFRMVRRLRAKNLDANEGKGEWNMQPCSDDPTMCQRVVMRADAIDNATHSMGAEWKIPPLDYYVRVAPAAFWVCFLRPVLIPKRRVLQGATPWYVDLGAGFGVYMMAAVRFWHFGPNYPGPGSCENRPFCRILCCLPAS